MDCLILAAGRGSRLTQISRDLPKCLVPLTSKITNTLHLLIKQLSSLGFRQIAIAGGYNYGILERYVSREILSEFSINMVDAQQVWEKGPLFSYLSYFPHDPTLVIPGDTIFSRNVINGIVAAIQTQMDEKVCLFYTKSLVKPVGSNHILDLSAEGNVIGISTFQTRTTLDRQTKSYHFLLPIAFVFPEFSDLCRNILDIGSLGHEPSLFGAIQQFLHSGGKILAREILSEDPYFQDIDTPQHLESVKKILSEHPERFL